MQLTVIDKTGPKTFDPDVAAELQVNARYLQMRMVPGLVCPVSTASNVLLYEMSRDVVPEGRDRRPHQMTAKARLFLATYAQTENLTEAANRSGPRWPPITNA